MRRPCCRYYSVCYRCKSVVTYENIRCRLLLSGWRGQTGNNNKNGAVGGNRPYLELLLWNEYRWVRDGYYKYIHRCICNHCTITMLSSACAVELSRPMTNDIIMNHAAWLASVKKQKRSDVGKQTINSKTFENYWITLLTCNAMSVYPLLGGYHNA